MGSELFRSIKKKLLLLLRELWNSDQNLSKAKKTNKIFCEIKNKKKTWQFFHIRSKRILE